MMLRKWRYLIWEFRLVSFTLNLTEVFDDLFVVFVNDDLAKVLAGFKTAHNDENWFYYLYVEL